MMASSSIIILGLHFFWLVLFVIMVTILDKKSICYAQRRRVPTCATLGCYAEFKRGRNCQCDADCFRHENCCDDFVDCESCEDIGCGSRYISSRLCHCNDRCSEFDTCCSDYNNTCGFTRVGQTTMETPKKGTKALVAVTTSSIIVVIVAVVVLVFCVALRRKRIHTSNEENVDDRNYYEVGNANDRSYENVLPNDQGKQYERNIGYNPSTSGTNNYEGQLVANVAYESYR